MGGTAWRTGIPCQYPNKTSTCDILRVSPFNMTLNTLDIAAFHVSTITPNILYVNGKSVV